MKIPPILINKSKSHEVKLALILEYERDPGACENCGGMGFISMFLATNGPFETPGSPGKFVSKWHNGKWWCAPSGSNDFGTISAVCPSCGGIKGFTRMEQVPIPADAMNPIKRLSEGMAK